MEAKQSIRLVILGAGGHGRVVADAAAMQGGWAEIVVTDRDPLRCHGDFLAGVPMVKLEEAVRAATAMHVAIGDGAAREREVLAAARSSLVSIAHPAASMSRHSQVGPGCFIAAQAVIAPGARVGVAVIVNHGAVVDHDVEIGDFSHIAPLAALGGGARIGRHVLVGAGARVLPGVSVTDGVTLGAGAVVAESITQPGTYAGVPARRLE